MKPKKRCPFCGTSFDPHPRLGPRQITCGRDDCKRQQKHKAQNRWERKNRDLVFANQRDWRKKNPRCWRDYRRDHPAYAQRNREQARLRKAVMKSGLQNRIDILQPFESQVKFWNIPRFAKRARSTLPLLIAYAAARNDTLSGRAP